ncbi:Gfo/Idh/MocA family oxidoreductase [Algoriphagus sp. oki45]|uniref:Gfo/Idh/MocA family protein n=1 Tax=Algoriphagus sp. oki45 TaxID=3067294 RepID=UPI0027EFC563|nr:Gfo/Idh/MocA family oxidoreductase [Algoriphagus sp. oki45]
MSTNRRDFLKTGATAVLGLSGLTIVSPQVLGRSHGYVAPNDQVNLACIGIGNRGAEIIKALHKTGLCNIVAICDVDMGAKQTLEVMNMFPQAKKYQDFRKMFDEIGGEFEAVSIATPDFSHFPVTMMALAEGKHVYVEKPMARTFLEVELMMAAAKKNPKLATQMGNQGHSEGNYFQFKTWKEAGIIKDVTAMTAHMNSRRRWHGWDPNISQFPAGETIPDTLNWDVWTSQAQPHAFNKNYHNGQWRCWYDFGMGALGDWGAHIMDTAHEFLELGLPYEINPTKLSGHNSFFFPMSTTLEFKFPERGAMPPMTITWYDGLDNIPAVPDGYGVSELDPNIPPPSNGQIQPAKLNPGKIIYSKELTFKGGSHGSTLSIIPSEKAKEWESKLPEVPQSPSNHFENFLKACKGEEKTRSPFEIAGPLSQVFCLGVLAQWTGLKLEFDRETKQITNNSMANQLLMGLPPRKGWEEFYKV